MPEWDREPPQTALTRPHRKLMDLLRGMGLEVRAEVRVGRYVLDVLVDELWVGLEADGQAAHAGPRKRKRDAERDVWILVNAGIPILRVSECELKMANRPALNMRIHEFVDSHSEDTEERRARGRWVTG
jgi:very-short-patch-repair endonuclease